MWSFQFQAGSYDRTYNNRIIIVNKKNNISFSKKLPDYSTVIFVSKNAKFAIFYDKNYRYYKYGLKSGKITIIKGLKKQHYSVLENQKRNNIYFVDNNASKTITLKLIGSRTKTIKMKKEYYAKLEGSKSYY